MKIYIFGSSGMLGGYLKKYLLQNNIEVISINRNKLDVLNISYSKGKNALLVKKMLGLNEKEESFEMKASNVEIRTVDLSKNEHMSFPHINFVDMSKETDFQDSEFYNQVSPKFLFVIFDKDDNGNQFLKSTKTYRLGENELLEVEKVWKHTLSKIKEGIYDEFMLHETSRPKDLIRARNAVAHIRPHDSKNSKTNKWGKNLAWINRDDPFNFQKLMAYRTGIENDNLDTFKYVKDCDMRNYVMGASISGQVMEKQRDDGLVERHAYSILITLINRYTMF